VPLPQKNFGYSVYVSDDGNSYALKADAGWIATSGSGSATVTTEAGYGAKSRNRQPRMVTFRDPSTSRIVRYPVFTPTAYAALQTTPITYSVPVVGSATNVTYNQDKLDPERVARRTITRNDPDHA
jgi:hypothetical protein